MQGNVIMTLQESTEFAKKVILLDSYMKDVNVQDNAKIHKILLSNDIKMINSNFIYYNCSETLFVSGVSSNSMLYFGTGDFYSIRKDGRVILMTFPDGDFNEQEIPLHMTKDEVFQYSTIIEDIEQHVNILKHIMEHNIVVVYDVLPKHIDFILDTIKEYY